jgi:hypothetical protein
MRMVSTPAIAAAVAALLAATLTGAAPARAGASARAARSRGCAASWQAVAEPATPGSNQLYTWPVAGGADDEFAPDTGMVSETVLSSGNAWFSGVDGYSTAPWTLHWNGHSAATSAADFPQGVYSPGSSGVASFDSSRDGWLIGAPPAGIEGSVGPPAERWHGGHWLTMPFAVSPQPAKEDVFPQDVVSLSPGDAWAVGQFGNPAAGPGRDPIGALIEHWDGTAWSIVANPASSRPSGLLAQVAGSSPGNIWAAGVEAGGKAGFLPLVEHFNGTRWSVLPPIPLSPGYQGGSAVSVSATSDGGAWVGGFEMTSGSPGRARFLAARWNGTGWTVRAPASPAFNWVPDDGVTLGLTSIYAASATDLWAIPVFPDYRSQGAYFLHWDGGRWSTAVVPGPQEYGLQYFYNAIAGTGPGNVWADGYVYSETTGNVMPQIAHLGCAS